MLNGGLGLGMLFYAKDLASDVMARLEGRFRSLDETSAEATNNLQKHFQGIKMGIAGMAAGGAVIGIIGKIGASAFQAAGQMEMYSVSLETMLTQMGSAKSAAEFLAELQEFAKDTPFEFEGLVESTKMLMAFGFQAERILPMMTSIGDAIAGLGGGAEAQQRVIRALGQMQAKGRLMAEELLQLMEVGIPVFQILQEELGLTGEEISNIGNLSVSATEGIEAILRGLDKRYGGLMEKQAKTAQGMIARIKDAAHLLRLDIGEGFLDSFKGILVDVGNLVDDLKESGAMRGFGRGIGSLLSVVRPIALVVFAIVRAFGQLAGTRPEIMQFITALVGVGGAVLFVGGATMFLRSGLSLALQMVQRLGLASAIGFGPLLGWIVGVSAALALFRLAYERNFAGFRQLVDNTVAVWRGFWALVSSARMEGGQLVGNMPQQVRDALENAGLLDFALMAFQVFARLRAMTIGIGRGVLEVFSWVRGAMSPVVWTLELLARAITWVIGLFSGAAGRLASSPSSRGWETFGKVVGWILGSLLVAMAVKAVIALGSVASAAIAAGAALLATPVGMVIAGLVAIGAAVYGVVRYWDELKAAGAAAWSWLQEMAAAVPGWAVGLLTAFAPFIGIPLLIVRNWESIVEFFRELPGRIGGAIETITGWFDGLISGVSKVGGWFARLLGFDVGQEIIPDPSGAAVIQGGPLMFPEVAMEAANPVVAAPDAGISFPNMAAAQTAAVLSAPAGGGREVVADRVQAASPIRQPIQLVLDGRVVAEVVAEIDDEDERRQGRW